LPLGTLRFFSGFLGCCCPPSIFFFPDEIFFALSLFRCWESKVFGEGSFTAYKALSFFLGRLRVPFFGTLEIFFSPWGCRTFFVSLPFFFWRPWPVADRSKIPSGFCLPSFRQDEAHLIFFNLGNCVPASAAAPFLPPCLLGFVFSVPSTRGLALFPYFLRSASLGSV